MYGRLPGGPRHGRPVLLLGLLSFLLVPTTAPAQTEEPAPEAPGTELFTGAAAVEIPLLVAPGLAQNTPRIVLRYDSGTRDALGTRGQAQAAGLGWSLDTGGVIVRDAKGTDSTSDDTFELVIGGIKYPLVRVDSTSRIWHTKDEQFWRIQYQPSGAGDDWTLTTRDGTRYRFGSNPDSRWIAINPGRSGVLTHRWLLSELITPNNVAIQYAYEKQVGSYTSWLYDQSWTYDQAIYPSRIRYSYYNGVLVGPAREVVFTLEARQDYPSPGLGPAYYETRRVSGLDVLVNGALVRRYAFSQDYSIDRDPGYTWYGGAAGDLTLTSVTEVAANGASLPPIQLAYHGDGALRSMTSSIGGTITFSIYDRIQTVPLGNYAQSGTTVGHIAKATNLGNRTLYEICTLYDRIDREDVCRDFGVSTSIGPMSRLLGYVFSEQREGSRMLYSACLNYQPPADAGDSGSCLDWGVTTSSTAKWASPLGYAYIAPLDRRRVTTRETSDGRTAAALTRFAYGTPGLSADGRVFRGHSWVKVVDPANHYTVTWFHQDEARKGRPYKVEWREAAPSSGGEGRLFRRVELTWQGVSNPAFPGATFAALGRRDVHTYDGDPSLKTTQETYTYDDLGNLTVAEHHGDTTVGGDERTEEFDYAPNTDAPWIVGLPSRHAIKAGIGAGATPLAERWFRYDNADSHTVPPTTGNLTEQIDWLDGGMNPSLRWTYDQYGNVRTFTNRRGYITEITYDPDYQTFPHTVTTPPVGTPSTRLVTTYTYDAGLGAIRTVVDPNQQTTEYRYDVFGRLEAVVDSLTQITRIAYENLGVVGSQKTTVRVPDEAGSADGIWRATYFDGFGRPFEVHREGATAGSAIIESVEYDPQGLIHKRSLPRFAADLPQWTTHAYDALRRLKQRTLPDTATESWAYNDWTTTYTNLRGFQWDYVADAYGRIARVIEPLAGGTTRAETVYTYDALDRLRTVTDALQKTTTIHYDTLSRRTALDDPTLGFWTYVYDANGNLTTRTDAKSQVVSFQHDALDQVLRKSYPDGRRIDYEYRNDEPPTLYARGRLRRAVEYSSAGTLSVANEYEYDPLGRVKALTRVVDNLSYRTGFTYTPFDALKTLKYPDGEVLTYEYDTAGQVIRVAGMQDIERIYLESATYNAAGQPTRMQRHGGVITDWAYSPTRLWLTAVRSTASTTTLQDLAFGRDAAGNVTSITNHVDRLFDQTFEDYDALDRLKRAVGPYGTHTYSYDPVGNLLTMGGASHSYGATAVGCGRAIPYAVASTSYGFTGAYDCNGNLLRDGARTFVWDPDDRPTVVTHTAHGTTNFQYGPDGERVKKATATKTTRYSGWFEDRVEENVLLKHVFAAGRRIATRLSSSGPEAGVYVPLDNHLGSLHTLVREGQVVLRPGYLPFGESDTARTAGTADWYQHRFTGQEQDPETELYYHGARYYDPRLGRFISPDPLVSSPYNPQSLNRWSYVRNNPLRYTDSSGYGIDGDQDRGLGMDAGAGVAAAAGSNEPGRDAPDTPAAPAGLGGSGRSGALHIEYDENGKAWITVGPGGTLLGGTPPDSRPDGVVFGSDENVPFEVARNAGPGFGPGRSGVGLPPGGRGAPRAGRPAAPSAQTPTDRIVNDQLNLRTLDAARREMKGEVVGRRPADQKPYDHVQKVRNAQQGLLNRMDEIQRELGRPGLTPAERAALEAELGKASRALDFSEAFVPR